MTARQSCVACLVIKLPMDIARGPSLFSFMNHSTNALFEGSFEWLRGVCFLNPYLLNQERYVTTAVCMILCVGSLPKMK